MEASLLWQSIYGDYSNRIRSSGPIVASEAKDALFSDSVLTTQFVTASLRQLLSRDFEKLIDLLQHSSSDTTIKTLTCFHEFLDRFIDICHANAFYSSVVEEDDVLQVLDMVNKLTAEANRIAERKMTTEVFVNGL